MMTTMMIEVKVCTSCMPGKLHGLQDAARPPYSPLSSESQADSWEVWRGPWLCTVCIVSMLCATAQQAPPWTRRAASNWAAHPHHGPTREGRHHSSLDSTVMRRP
mmetsp:Transcript_6409/g.17396  ORF Transcript_6409/g.17396 Transcript_6409/m.17396 type:complete len:105 (-) Transcript_6409:289-603(-)